MWHHGGNGILFLNFAEGFLNSDPRFSYRFIDRVLLKGFREPLTLFELLLDNDARFEIKKNSIPLYSEAYAKYCQKKWEEAKETFYHIYHEYGLGLGAVMAKRCDLLASRSPTPDWNGIWELEDKWILLGCPSDTDPSSSCTQTIIHQRLPNSSY